MLIWFAGLSIGTWRTVVEWRAGDLGAIRTQDETWPTWVRELLAGIRRATLPVLAGGWGLGLLLLGARLLRSYGRDRLPSDTVQAQVVRLIDGGSWFLIACGVCFLSILFFNRPRFLVPPSHRTESGWLGRP